MLKSVAVQVKIRETSVCLCAYVCVHSCACVCVCALMHVTDYSRCPHASKHDNYIKHYNSSSTAPKNNHESGNVIIYRMSGSRHYLSVGSQH